MHTLSVLFTVFHVIRVLQIVERRMHGVRAHDERAVADGIDNSVTVEHSGLRLRIQLLDALHRVVVKRRVPHALLQSHTGGQVKHALFDLRIKDHAGLQFHIDCKSRRL